MREDLVKSAVSFLSSEKVKTADKEKKVQFLKQKGLNEEEINEAFNRVESTATESSANVSTNSINLNAPKLPPRSPSLYQPVQVVYYPPPPISRMSLQQMVRYALIFGVSAFGITVAFTAVIKRIMSKILNSIANYQSHRYNEHRKVLSHIETTLKSFAIARIENEQKQMHESLNKLADTIQTFPRKDTSYKECLSSLERFKNTLNNNPIISSSYQNRAFGSYSGFADAYADRYQVNTEQTTILQGIKSDIRSIKGSLLSRRNFPTTSSFTPPTQTFIPPPPTPVDPNSHHPRNKYQRNT